MKAIATAENVFKNASKKRVVNVNLVGKRNLFKPVKTVLVINANGNIAVRIAATTIANGGKSL